MSLSPPSAFATKAKTVRDTVVHHIRTHAGVGIICAVAYFDPGNWSVDLQAGATFGYRPMLFVLLAAGISAIILQTLACKLGCVTGLDLASHCRLLLHDRPKHTRLIRWLALYPLYVLAEIAIIATDLAELLGSAIGFCLLFPKLPLWAGVLLTAGDVFVFLLLSDPTRAKGKPARAFEMIIIILVFAVFICFLVLLVKIHPEWSHVLVGYLPSKTLFQSQPDAVYTAVGILGATVMPHALFLGSYMATQDRDSSTATLSLPTTSSPRAANFNPRSIIKRFLRPERVVSSSSKTHQEHENNSLSFINRHLTHLTLDVVLSLALLAVPINSAILIVAATTSYHPGSTELSTIGLFEAHDLIVQKVGSAAGILFALALLCSGQTAGITATLAGQIVSEGFIEWKVHPFLRRIITRSISLIPSVVVALAVGRDGLNALLVASQVVLSVVLPFIAFPLIYLTSSSGVMRVQDPTSSVFSQSSSIAPEDTGAPLSPNDRDADGNSSIFIAPTANPLATMTSDDSIVIVPDNPRPEEPVSVKPEVDTQTPPLRYIEFRSGRVVMGLAYIIGVIVLTANIYAIVMLILGTRPSAGM